MDKEICIDPLIFSPWKILLIDSLENGVGRTLILLGKVATFLERHS